MLNSDHFGFAPVNKLYLHCHINDVTIIIKVHRLHKLVTSLLQCWVTAGEGLFDYNSIAFHMSVCSVHHSPLILSYLYKQLLIHTCMYTPRLDTLYLNHHRQLYSVYPGGNNISKL